MFSCSTYVYYFAVITYVLHDHPDSSAVINGSATITVSGLNCLVTYTVTAGGTLGPFTLVGPRSSHGNITTGDCMMSVAPTTTTTIGKNSKILFKYIATYIYS